MSAEINHIPSDDFINYDGKSKPYTHLQTKYRPLQTK